MPMNVKENRSNNKSKALLLVLLLIFLGIIWGKEPEFWSSLIGSDSVAGGSAALAMNPAPERIEIDSSKKKAGENKQDLIQIIKKRKPSNRKLLLVRFSPTAIFEEGLPTPANPLKPNARDLAQTLNVNRVSKPLKLYSKLLYSGLRLSRLDGTRFEADGVVYRGHGVPPDHFFLYRWFIDCCSLDSQPFGIVVRSDELSGVQGSFWVHVAGTMKFRAAEGKKIAYLEAETVQRIPTPPPDKRYITY